MMRLRPRSLASPTRSPSSGASEFFGASIVGRHGSASLDARAGFEAGALVEPPSVVCNVHGSMGTSSFGIFRTVIRLLATGRLPVTSLVTARYPLERVLEAIDRAAERRDGKVMVFA